MPLLSKKKKWKWKGKKEVERILQQKKSSESDTVRWGPLVVQGGITSPGGPKNSTCSCTREILTTTAA